VGARDRVLRRKLDVELDLIAPPDWAANPPARRRERTMEAVGLVATLVAAVGVLAGTVMSVRSLPDIAHYRRLRRM
jgi:hypothetical protein